MKTYSFTFFVSVINPFAEDFEDVFFEAGCDDATLSLMNDVVAVDFDRMDEDYARAILSAYTDILKTGAHIERFEPDYLVSKAEIASRANLTRAAISLYVKGERGKDFPKPIARISTPSPLWDWVEVSSWFHAKGQLEEVDVVNAKLERDMNYFLLNRDGEIRKSYDDFLNQIKAATPQFEGA